jgi:enamine deaminase RidA (YjgF/YER057c/UK114 family)
LLARRALQNIVDVLKVAGAKPKQIVRMTWYVTDKREYVAAYDANRSWCRPANPR